MRHAVKLIGVDCVRDEVLKECLVSVYGKVFALKIKAITELSSKANVLAV